MIHKNCLVCGLVFQKKPTVSKEDWTTTYYCSKECYWQSKKGKTSWNKGLKFPGQTRSTSFKKGRKTWNKGLLGYMAGSLNGRWQGDDITYGQKHERLTTKYGRPKQCEFCDKVGEKKLVKTKIFKRWTIEWALKHGREYSTNKEDYFQLCRRCHSNYDRH